MILVAPTIDQVKGELIVAFPQDSGLPSFAVPLNPSDEQKKGYHGYVRLLLCTVSNPPADYRPDCRMDHAIHFGQDLFPVLVPDALPSHSTERTPSELFSVYLGKDVRFVMQAFEKRPLLKFEPKDGDLEYEGVGETSFADGYPFLLATEGEEFEGCMLSIMLIQQPFQNPTIMSKQPWHRLFSLTLLPSTAILANSILLAGKGELCNSNDFEPTLSSVEPERLSRRRRGERSCSRM